MGKITGTDNLDYVIIDCGYSSRLVEPLGLKIKKTIKPNTDEKVYHDNSIHKVSIPKEDERDYLEEYDIDKDFLDNFVYIYDFMGGTFVKDYDESMKIMNIIKKNNIDAIRYICFKNMSFMYAMRCVESLRKLDFCACLGFENIDDMKIIEDDGLKILTIRIDTESG